MFDIDLVTVSGEQYTGIGYKHHDSLGLPDDVSDWVVLTDRKIGWVYFPRHRVHHIVTREHTPGPSHDQVIADGAHAVSCAIVAVILVVLVGCGLSYHPDADPGYQHTNTVEAP